MSGGSSWSCFVVAICRYSRSDTVHLQAPVEVGESGLLCTQGSSGVCRAACHLLWLAVSLHEVAQDRAEGSFAVCSPAQPALLRRLWAGAAGWGSAPVATAGRRQVSERRHGGQVVADGGSVDCRSPALPRTWALHSVTRCCETADTARCLLRLGPTPAARAGRRMPS